MESQETKQSEQGQVSAPGESPKDETQNKSCKVEYTAEEQLLARRHKVEPKLIRLLDDVIRAKTRILNDVIDDRTRELESSIDENLQLLNEFIKDRPAKTEPTAAESDIEQINQILKRWPKERVSFLAESLKHPPGVLQDAKEQAEPETDKEAEPEQEDESPEDDKPEPTTGIPQLDKLIEEALYESQAMAYVCLDLCQRDASLGDRITTLLCSSIGSLRDSKIPKGADFECDVAPATKWLRFMDGFQAGLISKQSVDQTASTETEQESKSEEIETQQGHVDAPGESPKDNESEFQEQRFQNCVDEIQKAVSHYPVENRSEVLAAALEQTTKAKGAADEIVEIEQEIRRACDALLDPKAKATIALLSELSSLSGISNVGIDYATDILHSTYGQKQVKQAREQFPDDNNVAFLSHVFGLAHSVVKADDKIFLQEVLEQAETIKQPQETEPQEELEPEIDYTEEAQQLAEKYQPDQEEIEAPEELQEPAEQPEPEEVSYGYDPKERVRAYETFEQWLNNRTLNEKRAALALSMLLGKQEYLPDEHIGDKLYKQWRDEVLALDSLDQLQNKGVPGNEAFCQGYLTAMLIMNG